MGQNGGMEQLTIEMQRNDKGQQEDEQRLNNNEECNGVYEVESTGVQSCGSEEQPCDDEELKIGKDGVVAWQSRSSCAAL